jgi:hypothetical protein
VTKKNCWERRALAFTSVKRKEKYCTRIVDKNVSTLFLSWDIIFQLLWTDTRVPFFVRKWQTHPWHPRFHAKERWCLSSWLILFVSTSWVCYMCVLLQWTVSVSSTLLRIDCVPEKVSSKRVLKSDWSSPDQRCSSDIRTTRVILCLWQGKHNEGSREGQTKSDTFGLGLWKRGTFFCCPSFEWFVCPSRDLMHREVYFVHVWSPRERKLTMFSLHLSWSLLSFSLLCSCPSLPQKSRDERETCVLSSGSVTVSLSLSLSLLLSNLFPMQMFFFISDVDPTERKRLHETWFRSLLWITGWSSFGLPPTIIIRFLLCVGLFSWLWFILCCSCEVHDLF